MSSAVKESWFEALVGLGVILLALWFVQFAAARTGGRVGTGDYELRARFPNVGGVAVGTDVRVSGLKVGAVRAVTLDPKTFNAEVRFTVNGDVKLPKDSSAAITSQGLLGGSFIALVPGGAPEMLKPGEVITDTQGAADLMGLIGSVVNRSGGGAASGGAPAPAASPPPAPAAAAANGIPPETAVEPAVEPAAAPAK
ncbi:MAG: outer membrane lipid asymmetry maintenance protein MlaD [Sphingomonadaceae bacterium]|nr:outer membrane lipid asymmetry maintenance protein MlaD [Sphingomonadaceae bacterium]